MGKITYADKTAINENTGVAATNKVQAADMNEIKSVVNGLIKNTQTSDTESTYSCDYFNNYIVKGVNYITIGKICIAWGNFTKGLVANGKVSQTIALPKTFANTNYSVSITTNNDYSYNTEVSYLSENKTTSSFSVGIWNNSNSTPTASVQYIVIGETK